MYFDLASNTCTSKTVGVENTFSIDWNGTSMQLCDMLGFQRGVFVFSEQFNRLDILGDLLKNRELYIQPMSRFSNVQFARSFPSMKT